MLRIFYISAATRFPTARELDDILAVSRERNLADQITGLLLYHDGSFAQILEGPDEAVRNCFKRIKADDRHLSCRLLLEEEITERYFENWSLGCALSVAPASMKPNDTLSFSKLRETPSFQRTQENIILKSFLSGFLPNAAPAPAIKPERRAELHRLLEANGRSNSFNDDYITVDRAKRPSCAN